MECRDVLEAAVDRRAGGLPPDRETELERHLADCAGCRNETAALDAAWERLADDPDAPLTAEFRRQTLARLKSETLGRKVVRFETRRRWAPLARIAALVAAAAGGFLLSRITLKGVSPGGSAPPASAAAVLPDLSQRPRLANVSYRPADPSGRIGVSFDVTTHHTVLGRPSEKGVSELLAYLMSGAADCEGTRGKAIDLVSQHYPEGSTPSPQIVAVLTETLKKDKNPGVRKKAAEALGQLAPTPEIRDAFVAALKSDANPAIRMIAIEALAKAASTLKDPATIETLRERANDAGENGYVRVKAASALKHMDL